MSKESRQRLRKARIEREWMDLYGRHMQAHEQETAHASMQRLVALRDPAVRVDIGLPAEMPEESLLILARAHAYDKIGPLKPRISNYDSTSAPTVLHNVYRK